MKVIAFNLDDTLVRWHGPVREAVARTAALSAPPIDAEAFAGAITRVWYGRADEVWTGWLGQDEITREASAAITAALREAEGARLYALYIRNRTELIEPYEDTPALRPLRRGYRLGVATNGIGETQRGKLRKAGLGDLFDFVVVGNNVARDLLSAVAAGMRAVWVQRADDASPEASWDGPAVTSLYDLEAVLQRPG